MSDAGVHIALAMTGASGIQYGLKLLQVLLQQDVRVSLMLSDAAKVVIAMETDLKLPRARSDVEIYFKTLFDVPAAALDLYADKQWSAPVASGSAAPDAMVVCPCTTGTLAAIATGQSRCLIERAADVVLKERRRLVLVVRETPFSEIHLENMLKLSRMGVVIMPANPGFYHKPTTVDDLIDFMVARTLDQLGLDNTLVPRWGSAVSIESE